MAKNGLQYPIMTTGTVSPAARAFSTISKAPFRVIPVRRSEEARSGGTVLQGLFVGELNGGAISKRIGEWDSDLDHIGTSGLHAQKHVDRTVDLREAWRS